MCHKQVWLGALPSILQKVAQVAVGGRLTGCWELWKVPTEPHLIEAAQVILTCLVYLENAMALHVVQQHAKRIGTLGFFT